MTMKAAGEYNNVDNDKDDKDDKGDYSQLLNASTPLGNIKAADVERR